MARTRSRRAAAAPPKELVISVDKRLFVIVGLACAFVAAVALGTWTVNRGVGRAEPAAVATDVPAAPGVAAPGLATLMPEEDARATAVAMGLPSSVAIVQPILPVGTTVPGDLDVPGVMHEVPKEQVTPVDELQADLLEQEGVTTFEVDPDRAIDTSGWTADTMANFEDPNVTLESTTPIRAEYAEGPYVGPRIAISELNDLYTFSYGLVPRDQTVSHDFTLSNVGDQPLVVSRIYAACGCTAAKVGSQAIPADGFLVTPLQLAPGQSQIFTVTYDPRTEKEPGVVAKYVQIFSNDSSRTAFDPADPNSYEVRMRIVIEAR